MSIITTNAVSYEEALATILNSAWAYHPSLEVIELRNSLNRILAEDIYSDINIPGADNSSMDGYCLQQALTKGASRQSPIRLPIVSGVDAGHTIKEVPQGHCAYIATGGMLPPGTDSVVKIEDTELSPDGALVTIFAEVAAGNFVRPVASEIKQGQLIVKAATKILPFVAGQIASAGKTAVKILKKPTVAILTSGDEVLMPWEQPRPWQVRNANSIMLCAQAEECGAQALDIGIARDTGNHAREMFLSALESADVVVTSGGISMGRRDPFKNVFNELEIKPLVSGIKMKPGKPFFFGMFKNKPVFGLPGNPLSSAVTFELFVKPFIGAMQGVISPRIEVNLELAEPSSNDSGRDFFKCGQLNTSGSQVLVSHLSSQESHMLTALARADLLFVHPVEPRVLPTGSKVKCILLKG